MKQTWQSWFPRSRAFLGQKCHFLRQIGKSKETWRQTMLFVWWAALRLSVHLLTVKERRCDTSERSVITPAIIMETILQNEAAYLFFFFSFLFFKKQGKKSGKPLT